MHLQSREILKTFVWGLGGGGDGQVCVPTIQTSGKFNFDRVLHITSIHGKFTNFKALFPVL